MTYRRVLLGRWSRRDRLAVLVVAVGVAFLCGTALLVVVAGDQTTALAADYGATATVTAHPSVEAAAAAAPPGAAVLPFATVTDAAGTERTVLARPTDATGVDVGLTAESGVTLGGIDATTNHTLTGTESAVTVGAVPRGRSSPLPDRWYLADRGTVERLGPSGAFVVRPVPDDVVPTTGVPLRAALAFFVLGTREALAALGTIVAGSAVLVGVVVYSVTRMTIRDRRETIQVVRATGGQGWTVVAVFAARAGLITLTGGALGYAVGVIGVNAAVNAAVFAGLPTSLSPTVTPAVAAVFAGILGVVVALGVASGVLAALPVVRRAPFETAERAPRSADATATTESVVRRLRSVVTPTLLDVRAVVPTAATLATFVAFAVLVAAMGGVIAPLSGGEGATVTEPGAAHPVASTVPATYAGALRAQGIDASPELLVFEARDDQPYTVRGVDYTAFSSVTESTLVDGRRPTAPDEAVIGADLSRTLGVGIGDRVTLGGTTQQALDRVEVVGVFRAPGAFDDQLLVSLSTARHLANKPPGTVQFVRADRLPDSALAGDAVRVVDLAAPDTVARGDTLTARVTLVNRRDSEVTTTVPVAFGDRSTERTVTLAAGASETVTVEFVADTAGLATLRAGAVTRSVRVGSDSGEGSLAVGPLPERGPPNATLSVRVRDAEGDPVANASVTAGETTLRTNADGVAHVQTGDTGTLTISARAGNRTGTASLDVVSGAEREPTASVGVAPDSPDLLTPVTARATLSNPWNATLSDVPVTVAVGGQSVQQTVTVPPGERRTVRLDLGRLPPGTYEATVRVRGDTLATREFRVRGDDRVAAALAAGGRTGTSGIGRAIETAFGNLQLVLGVVLGLAAALTVGGTTATFARAVHGRRATVGVYRATGAAPVRILRVILADAARIGTLATCLAVPVGLAGLQVAEAFGYLTVFGVRITPTASPAVLAGAALGGVGLTLAGATLATASLLRESPAALVRDESPVHAPDGGGDS